MAPLFFSKLRHHSIQTEDLGDYQVFSIKEDLALGSDFGALTAMVDKAIKKGKINIAIQFTARSYLYTPTVARLVEYYKLLKDKGGNLCLIQPNDEILEVLNLIGFAKLVRIVPSVEELEFLPTH